MATVALPRSFSAQQLTDLVTLMRASLMGLDQATKVEPSGTTRLRELPEQIWRDPVFQQYVNGAYQRLVQSMTRDPGVLSIRLFDMPAAVAYALVSQIAGHLSASGNVTGGISPDPLTVRWAQGLESGRPGASKGVFIGLVAAAGVAGFLASRAVAAAVRG